MENVLFIIDFDRLDFIIVKNINFILPHIIKIYYNGPTSL
jgi:hypothetical protein